MPLWASPYTHNSDGLPVLGSYGQGLLIETFHLPAGYVAIVATAGPGNLNNVVGVREHVNPAYRGLRQIAGNWQNFLIIESFSVRSVGVGTRHRGAGCRIQVTDQSTYAAPAKTDFGLSASMSVVRFGNAMTMPFHIPREYRSTEYVSPPPGWFNVALANLTAGNLKAREGSELSHGPGLRTPELRDAPPKDGGRYRPVSPPSAWPYPPLPRITSHIRGYSVGEPPKRCPRSPYDD